jgi:hypothetical protein
MAAVDGGRRHQRGELINMVGDGSGRVSSIPRQGWWRWKAADNIDLGGAISLALWAKLGKSVKVAKDFPGSRLKTFSQLLPDS